MCEREECMSEVLEVADCRWMLPSRGVNSPGEIEGENGELVLLIKMSLVLSKQWLGI